MSFNYRIIIALCCSQYYRVNMVRVNFIYHLRNIIRVMENVICHIRRYQKN